LLRAADVSFTYGGAPVLEGVSLELRAGELTGILGPNGSGKTTLLKLLAGTLAPGSGAVTLGGVPFGRIARAAVARRVAVVPQELQLAFDYSVLEIALMGRYPHLGPFELEGPEDVEIARRALEATGTWGLARRPFATLSGGEKQRVVIASALAQFEPRARSGARAEEAPPQVLLLDEPTASLDVHYQVEVASLLRRLNRERGLTIVVSTHDLNFAASVCRELVLLREGRVLTAGPTERVLTPDRVRALYGVDAHVSFHEVAGHLTVVPLPPQEPLAGDGP
jgi:iron complex transport system ATP-binding protein